MALASMRRELARLRDYLLGQSTAATAPVLEQLQADPTCLFTMAGRHPDLWQRVVLRSPATRTLLCCSRQSGKSTTAAALALKAALLDPGALILLLSPALRQSGELFRKVVETYQALGRPVPSISPRDSQYRLELTNGSRVISLPGSEETIRGYSGVALLIIDEAARVPDDLYRAVRPMLATSQGKLVALSTPFGKRGWFYETWISPDPWHRVRVTAEKCPRISAEFLAEEAVALGPRWFAQEYGCEFLETIGSLFSGEAVAAMVTQAVAAVRFPE